MENPAYACVIKNLEIEILNTPSAIELMLLDLQRKVSPSGVHSLCGNHKAHDAYGKWYCDVAESFPCKVRMSVDDA
jgi:hypothetical protein